MRITKISIEQWRNFRHLDIEVPSEATLVCLVGGNGTGKSSILELLSACAQRVALAPGVEIPRGNPFGDKHSFSVSYFVSPTAFPNLEEGFLNRPQLAPFFAQWDRSLTLSAVRNPDERFELFAGGVPAEHQGSFGAAIVEIIRGSAHLHYLYLDSDRSYPKREIGSHLLGEIYQTPWDNVQQLKTRSYLQTSTLYDDWIKHCLHREANSASNYVSEIRLARQAGTPEPVFKDPFDEYRKSLVQVLAHLKFVGVDLAARTVKFDSAGEHLLFHQLSGGEREIAFLVGQIDRFRLKRGLFVSDEPELHLNPELIRVWIEFLSRTIDDGQVWMATHSLEAVEAAGSGATIVLERDDETRLVRTGRLLAREPLRSTLSRALGTPAFSIEKLRFVFVEGEPEIGERDRFKMLCPNQESLRFIEAGRCIEVARRVQIVRQLALESDQPIRVGGVVDKDWRDQIPSDAVIRNEGLFVLPLHEIENFFLFPALLNGMLRQNGIVGDAAEWVRNASNLRAGLWIFNRMAAAAWRDGSRRSLNAAKGIALSLSWDALSAAREPSIDQISIATQAVGEELNQLREYLGSAYDRYEIIQGGGNIWKECEGKQVFRSLQTRLGFATEKIAQAALANLWSQHPELTPPGLDLLRNYVAGL